MLVLKASPSFMQRIAVVEVFGTIGGNVSSSAHERVFTAIEKDDKIRALVLDVDSPGGGVSASDYLYRSVARIAEKKPVVASIRGSGRVRRLLHKLRRADNRRLAGGPGRLHRRAVRAARAARIAPQGRRAGQRQQERTPEGHGRRVARRHPRRDREDAGDGGPLLRHVRLYRRQRPQPGRRNRARPGDRRGLLGATSARELGLVDELGDLQRAIDIAAQLSGAPRKPVFMRPSRSLRAKLFGAMADSLVESVANSVERRMYNDAMRF